MHIQEPGLAAAGKIDFLSFRLGGLEYGLDFSKVRELRVFQSFERVAADGAVVKGRSVARGLIMPIVDMRMAAAGRRSKSFNDVIVLQLANCVMGLVVDGVTDVVPLRPDQITPLPADEGGGQCDYLLGLGRFEGRRLILVDIDKLMSIKRTAGEGEGARQAA